jgi:GntR family transcriptional regulator
MNTAPNLVIDGDYQELERASPIPLYYQIQRNLLEQIESGTLSPGAEIPTEKELMERYGVSRATVRRALDDLVRQGYITRQQGRGSFVAIKVEDTRSEKLRGFLEDMRERGFDVGCEILFNGHATPYAKVLRILEPTTGMQPYMIRRIGKVEGEPIGLAEVWLAVDKPVEISKEALAQYDVLYTFIENLYLEEYNLRLVSGKKTLQATVATPEEAELLHTEPGAPLLMAQVVIQTSTGKQVVYIKTLYRGDRYVYVTKLHT